MKSFFQNKNEQKTTSREDVKSFIGINMNEVIKSSEEKAISKLAEEEVFKGDMG